jgi:hypothetical protein
MNVQLLGIEGRFFQLPLNQDRLRIGGSRSLVYRR